MPLKKQTNPQAYIYLINIYRGLLWIKFWLVMWGQNEGIACSERVNTDKRYLLNNIYSIIKA
jgi:hypothetical protein